MPREFDAKLAAFVDVRVRKGVRQYRAVCDEARCRRARWITKREDGMRRHCALGFFVIVRHTSAS